MVAATESGSTGRDAEKVRVICPKCKTERPGSGAADSFLCRACGHYTPAGAAPPKARSLASWWQWLFNPAKGGISRAGLSATEPSPRRPAIRSGYHAEPFYGTEDYIAPVEEPEFGAGAADEFVEALEFESVDSEDLEFVEVPGIGFDPPHAGAGQASTAPEVGIRVVRCLNCVADLRVRRDAPSTVCRRCGCFVSLEDFEIRGHWRENIRTRGKVVVHRRASLSANEVACGSLKVYGRISGKIECSGDAMFRSSGKVVGAVRCRHIHVHKLSNIKFIPGIRAETAEIHGHVEGDIICEGPIQISKTGAVYGDCIAPSVKLEDGASLSGQMRFTKPDQALDQEYIRRAQAAQEAYFARELEAELEAFKNAPETGKSGGGWE